MELVDPSREYFGTRIIAADEENNNASMVGIMAAALQDYRLPPAAAAAAAASMLACSQAVAHLFWPLPILPTSRTALQHLITSQLTNGTPHSTHH